MLYPALLKSELHKRRDEFLQFEEKSSGEALEYARSLRGLAGRSAAEIAGLIQSGGTGNDSPGALPASELDQGGSVTVGFGRQWRSHEEARRWAFEVLKDRVTFAADGSQLLPGRDISLPIAAVQIAWFENFHSQDGGYIKQAHLEILSPSQLLDNDGQLNPDRLVTFHRTRLEIEKLCDFMLDRKGWQQRGERTPVAFFDGSLTYLISFPLQKAHVQNEYANAVSRLAEVSRETGVPVVGFVDHSYARELVKLIDVLEGSGDQSRRYPYNSQILRAREGAEQPLLSSWGDRTILFSFVPDSTAFGQDPEKSSRLFDFCYLQTTADSLPARLDIPAWIADAGLCEEVLDTVRAECVVGLGYPYAIETADEAAVITSRDRDLFLRALQDFAQNNDLAFRVSRKANSKARRR